MTRTENREALMKWFYECDMKEELDQLCEIPFIDKLRRRKAELQYAQNLTSSFVAQRQIIDETIEQSATDWRIERIGKVELAILRVAVTELLYLKDIPVAVTITQALELSKTYASDESAPFINGILGAVADANE
ncbi:MAG: transcription antitermination factor NusB [Bacillota bacterium]|nr:transcription antitermination factor NusB [Bacillota bacterium]